jgi:riboflavin biosynthesis pyrimidine reductase
MHARRFESFADRKTREAERASLFPLTTIEDRSSRFDLEKIGSEWSRRLYDGPFHLVRVTADPAFVMPDTGPRIPSISLVFVQSKDGNTGTDNPEELGGGATDKHVIYEGLSRVAADAVLAGAATASGENVFFSVWHPELVALRLSLGLPRHPIQVVVTGRASIDPDASLIFNVPDVPVVVLGGAYACQVLRKAAISRSWMHIVPMEGDDVRPALRRLASDFHVRRISCIGGRSTATRFLNAGLIQDLYLTTTTREAGEPNTPFYVGDAPPAPEPIVRKRGLDPDAPILFEHLRIVQHGTPGR